jgi:methylated-DNA-[protein]-cysteine S-methyltransferase
MNYSKSPQSFFCLRDTPFGPLAVLWSELGGKPLVSEIFIPGPHALAETVLRKAYPVARAGNSIALKTTLDQLDAYFSGEIVRFSLDNLRMDLCSPFQKKALLADYAIPRGKVSAYGVIAGRIGSPGAARAVGTVMASNPYPIVIPCHRVIRSDGSLGGYGGGLDMKRRLLEMEGVEFRDMNHVAEKCVY